MKRIHVRVKKDGRVLVTDDTGRALLVPGDRFDGCFKIDEVPISMVTIDVDERPSRWQALLSVFRF